MLLPVLPVFAPAAALALGLAPLELVVVGPLLGEGNGQSVSQLGGFNLFFLPSKYSRVFSEEGELR